MARQEHANGSMSKPNSSSAGSASSCAFDASSSPLSATPMPSLHSKALWGSVNPGDPVMPERPCTAMQRRLDFKRRLDRLEGEDHLSWSTSKPDSTSANSTGIMGLLKREGASRQLDSRNGTRNFLQSSHVDERPSVETDFSKTVGSQRPQTSWGSALLGTMIERGSSRDFWGSRPRTVGGKMRWIGKDFLECDGESKALVVRNIALKSVTVRQLKS